MQDIGGPNVGRQQRVNEQQDRQHGREMMPAFIEGQQHGTQQMQNQPRLSPFQQQFQHQQLSMQEGSSSHRPIPLHPLHQGLQSGTAWTSRHRPTKYRSASVNSNSSFESFYSGIGNHFETDQELSSFDSACLNLGGSAAQLAGSSPASHLHPFGNSHNITPPIKREQPSPFQPIYGGFSSTFAYDEHQNGAGPTRDVLEDFDGHSFTPLSQGHSMAFDSVPSNYQPGDSNSDAGIDHSSRFTPQPRLRVMQTPQSLPAQSPAGDLQDSDKKKKRKKKKKKSKSMNDDGEHDQEGGEPQEAMRCFNCDQLGHLSRDCTQPRACFLCGETTHVAKQCKFSALAQTASEDQAHSLPGPIAGTTQNGSRGPSPAILSANERVGPIPEESGDDSSEKKKNICLNCSEAGHRLKNCPYGRKCFQCGNVGHVARECPAISEAIKLMQKRRAEGTYTPDMLHSSNSVHPFENSPPIRSSASVGAPSPVVFSSSGNGRFYAAGSNAGASQFNGSPFMTTTSESISSSPSLRPESVSPPLMFGGGAFSSFGGMGIGATSGEGPRDSTICQPEHEDVDPSGEMNDPHLEDFLTHLIGDLDIGQDQ